MTPRTLADLRAAVGRVLAARGERADALRVRTRRSRIRPRWQRVVAVDDWRSGARTKWVWAFAGNYDAAAARAWRGVLHALDAEHRRARRGARRARTPVWVARAEERLQRAVAALAAARAVEAEGADGDGGRGGDG